MIVKSSRIFVSSSSIVEWCRGSGPIPPVQDFNYHFSNCMDITIENSCCKFPTADTLPRHWADNKEAILAYVEAAQVSCCDWSTPAT